MLKKITNEKARTIANILNIDLRKLPLKIWTYALNVELEHGTVFPHTNVTNDDLIMTGKIALAHLLEFPDYYQRLKDMEHTADKYWKNKKKPYVLKRKSSRKTSKKRSTGRCETKIKSDIITFFRKNPYPTDYQVHELAEHLDIDKHKFEEHIYALLTELIR